MNILSGRASWFLAALIVAEMLFTLVVHLTRGRLLPMGFVAVICLLASHFVGNRYSPTPLYFPADIWSVNEALLAFFLLYAGYVYRRFEKEIDGVPQRWLVVVLGLALVVLKLFILRGSEQMEMGLITVSNYPLFVADMLVVVFFMVTIFKQMPHIGFLAWTGSHTLVYYFFCGGAPFVVSLVLRKMGFGYSGFLSQAVAFMLVYLFATAIVWIFYRYTNIAKRPKSA